MFESEKTKENDQNLPQMLTSLLLDSSKCNARFSFHGNDRFLLWLVDFWVWKNRIKHITSLSPVTTARY